MNLSLPPHTEVGVTLHPAFFYIGSGGLDLGPMDAYTLPGVYRLYQLNHLSVCS